MEEEKVIHVINSPEEAARTAPCLKLKRPTIHYGRAVAFFLAHFFVAYLITFIVGLFIEKGFVAACLFGVRYFYIALLFLFLHTLRFSFIWFVRLYQRYAKAETRLRCCMTPSCSEYAILAFRKYGAIIGGIKTFRRLLRCHPPGGVDYP